MIENSFGKVTNGVLRRINPGELYNPAPYGYGHVSMVPPGAAVVFIAGQGGDDPTGSMVSADFGDQVRQAFANLLTALAAAGTGPENVAKLTTLVVDHNESKLEILADALRAIWGDCSPTQTLIPVPRLALDGMLFEVDAVAVVPQRFSGDEITPP